MFKYIGNVVSIYKDRHGHEHKGKTHAVYNTFDRYWRGGGEESYLTFCGKELYSEKGGVNNKGYKKWHHDHEKVDCASCRKAMAAAGLVASLPSKEPTAIEKSLKNRLKETRESLTRSEDVGNILSVAFSSIVSAKRAAIRTNCDTSEKCDSNGSYTFIPHNVEGVIERLLNLREHLMQQPGIWLDCFINMSFLDVGCGIGNILLLANAIGFGKAIGLEFDPFTIEQSKGLWPKGRDIRIEEMDIIKYNGYSLHDVIYFYRPFNCEDKQFALETKIVKQMKIGAYIIPVYGAYHCYNNDPRFERAGNGVYKKVKQQPETMRRR